MMAMPLNIIQFYVLFALTQMGNPIGLRKKIKAKPNAPGLAGPTHMNTPAFCK
jgi:hypothetical protein